MVAMGVYMLDGLCCVACYRVAIAVAIETLFLPPQSHGDRYYVQQSREGREGQDVNNCSCDRFGRLLL